MASASARTRVYPSSADIDGQVGNCRLGGASQEICGDQARIQGIGGAIRAGRAAGLRLSCGGSRVRFRLHQRSLSAMEACRRARPVFADVARRARRQNVARRDRHQRADADVPLPSLHRRPGVRHDGRDVPGTRRARHRHRRRTQRSAFDRPALAGIQGAVRASARSRHADPGALDPGAGQLRGPVLQDRESDDLRPPGYAGADLCRRRGRSRRALRRPLCRGVHLHERQEAGALHRDPVAEGRRGHRRRRRIRRDPTTA